MGQDKLADLLPGLTADDISSDTGVNVIDVDASSNPVSAEARTYSLQQLTGLFNVLLRRSAVQSRVTQEEKASRTLEAKVTELELWREELEGRLMKRDEDMGEKMQLMESKNAQLAHFTDYRFKEIADDKKTATFRY